MNQKKKNRIEFGDFQTPDSLAHDVCAKLVSLGISPDVVVEPTCGLGSFVVAAAQSFPGANKIIGIEINALYLEALKSRLTNVPFGEKVQLQNADFFQKRWLEEFSSHEGLILIIGNLPWVTNSAQASIGGSNLPEKSNFQKQPGFDAMTGKSNFDISESMLLELFHCLRGRRADIAILVKTSVARKTLAHLERQKAPVIEASIHLIDAKRDFAASVDACLLLVRLSDIPVPANYDYTVYDSLRSNAGTRVGHRNGFAVRDLESYEALSFLIGHAPQKWRSGVKHDASSVMEFMMTPEGLKNGLGETVDIEPDLLFPLLKGSDIGSEKPWREKFVLVTQRSVGERTEGIKLFAPKTWSYLEAHGVALDSRASAIYKKNPRFSIFGIGDYAFRPWKIAICSLYKSLKFRACGPIAGKPVMFDDTVYYLSFETEAEAEQALSSLNTERARRLLSSLIFWDDKRPIKTSVLNVLDWSRINASGFAPPQMEMKLPYA